MHVLATAGHVDHGKSTLVKALTGTDPDRLIEERERGLTIDLGFAWTSLGSGAELAFVDVPGHVRFIKNMLAGVGAVDACLFVVAATEGWKPQSEEHLRILELLGVQRGLVALTKVAGLDDEWRQLARLDVSDHLAGSFLAESEIVEVDAPAGEGVDALREALDRLLVSTPTAPDRARPRLWVDRSFSARGSGTVVTGTLTGGSLQVGEELVVVGPGVRRPQKVRVRALQSHNEARESVSPGRRVAVNLSGLAHERPYRGDALVRAGQWFLSRKLDCSLAVLAALDHDVSRRGAYQAYVGSGEHPVGLRVLGAQALSAGGAGHVRLHLPVPLPLLPGDRYVLRESGRSETVGGGEILDVDPVLPAAKASPSRSVARVVAERGWVDSDTLELLTGERHPPNLGGRWVVDPAALAEVTSSVGTAVAGAGPMGLDLATLDDRQRAVAATLEGVVIEDGRARARSSEDTREALSAHPFLAALRTSPFSPPDPRGRIERVELRALVRMGLVVERDGCCFAAEAVDEAARVVADLLQAHPEGVTVATIRDRLATTRKFILPLLAHLDANGVTRRRGDLRVAGPRVPTLG